MGPEQGVRRGWWALALLAGSLVPIARAEGPPDPAGIQATSSTFDAVASTLERGLELERKKNWVGAIRHYESALEQFPSKADFGHRLRLCEIHFRIARRYQDRSFREVLLQLPKAKANELLDEMLERIGTHYVEPVALEPIIRRGYDNLEVGLRDPAFLKVNAANADPSRIAWLRQVLRDRRDRLQVDARESAQVEVDAACELARQAIGVAAAPIVLEFVYAACDVLDPYSSYLSPDKLEDMFTVIDGNFVGLGVELKSDAEGLRLVGVIRGGPAAEAGLKAGDKIVAISGRSVKGLGLDEAAGQLQGAEGSTVDVAILRPDASTSTYRLARRHVEVESVAEAKIVDEANKVGYVQLTGFQKTSAEELDRAILALQKRGMRFLVLDLRGNPGGLLNVAVDIADRFVDHGIIVSTRGRALGQTQSYRARPDLVYTMPMAVLIDRDSASASEILAGALKDLNRATILGDRSYGKGSVQSIYELRSISSGLKLTTAQFYSPTGRPYSEQGVTPDTLVKVAAKPLAGKVGDDEEPAPAFEVGNPTEDPVLSRAIRDVRQKSYTAR